MTTVQCTCTTSNPTPTDVWGDQRSGKKLSVGAGIVCLCWGQARPWNPTLCGKLTCVSNLEPPLLLSLLLLKKLTLIWDNATHFVGPAGHKTVWTPLCLLGPVPEMHHQQRDRQTERQTLKKGELYKMQSDILGLFTGTETSGRRRWRCELGGFFSERKKGGEGLATSFTLFFVTKGNSGLLRRDWCSAVYFFLCVYPSLSPPLCPLSSLSLQSRCPGTGTEGGREREWKKCGETTKTCLEKERKRERETGESIDMRRNTWEVWFDTNGNRIKD